LKLLEDLRWHKISVRDSRMVRDLDRMLTRKIFPN